jgi:hypothetical protein
MGDRMQQPKYSRGDGRSNVPARILKRAMGIEGTSQNIKGAMVD